MSYLDLKIKTTPYTNGKHKYIQEVEEEYEERSYDSFVENAKCLWKRPTLNEWTCTLMLFLFSSSIVIGKLYLNYDFYNVLDINKFSENIPNLADNVIIQSFIKYGWFMKAVLSGWFTTGICWFMIYKDSHIPGVNPPSPFSPSKKRLPSEAPMPDMNYFVGGLLGVTMFVYKCL